MTRKSVDEQWEHVMGLVKRLEKIAEQAVKERAKMLELLKRLDEWSNRGKPEIETPPTGEDMIDLAKIVFDNEALLKELGEIDGD